MKPAVLTRRANYRRQIHYVDETLQKFFLAALVLLEVSLAVGLTWWMWQHLNQIVDDNLYRVHLAQAAPILRQLVQEALFLLGIFWAVNLAALLLVHWVWQCYVHSILRGFMQLMRKTAALDFAADPGTAQRHQILDLAERQREQDRQRFMAIRAQLAVMQPASPVTELAALLPTLRELLPPVPGTAPAPKSERRRRASDTI